MSTENEPLTEAGRALLDKAEGTGPDFFHGLAVTVLAIEREAAERATRQVAAPEPLREAVQRLRRFLTSDVVTTDEKRAALLADLAALSSEEERLDVGALMRGDYDHMTAGELRAKYPAAAQGPEQARDSGGLRVPSDLRWHTDGAMVVYVDVDESGFIGDADSPDDAHRIADAHNAALDTVAALGAAHEERGLDVRLITAVLKFYGDQMPAYAVAAGLSREEQSAVMVDVRRARAEYARLATPAPSTEEPTND